ncbi:uncharacterized protein N7503_010545 [Penicillium pulvis]|uniref:uncharacterized protein n=1 Tax=Penicillium pulvis TaxID=1562058 RepID=UPI002547350C|nr:uncharacterized protein N7503_010545 [Penicillium pulvis]KAJ5785333.1 hypothetical protein N7503_010545 [Penicillium pulvis]
MDLQIQKHLDEEGWYLSQLGDFVKLPVEIRWMIWEDLFQNIHSITRTTKSHNGRLLGILGCSRILYHEITHLLYKGIQHGIQICDDEPMWLVALSSKYVYATWAVGTVEAMSRHIRNFPHERVEEKSISIKVAGPDISEGDYMGYLRGIGQLLYRAVNLFDILTRVGPPRDVMQHVHIDVTGEWWHLRCKSCTDYRQARIEDIVNPFTSFRSYDIIGPEHIKSYLEPRLPLPKFSFSDFPYPWNTLGETDPERS